MYVFFDKSDHIWLHPCIFEEFWSEPLVPDKSFFFSGSWFIFPRIFYEKKWNFLMNHRSSLKICGNKGIVDGVHKLDDFEIFFWESCFLRNLAQGCLEWWLIVFYMPFWEDILDFITSISPSEHEYLYIRSSFSIHDTASTLFIEVWHIFRYKMVKSRRVYKYYKKFKILYQLGCFFVIFL